MFTCDFCGEEYNEDDKLTTINEEDICQECVNEKGYKECKQCGNYYTECGKELCEICEEYFPAEPSWIKDSEYDSHEEFMEHHDPDPPDDDFKKGDHFY